MHAACRLQHNLSAGSATVSERVAGVKDLAEAEARLMVGMTSPFGDFTCEDSRIITARLCRCSAGASAIDVIQRAGEFLRYTIFDMRMAERPGLTVSSPLATWRCGKSGRRYA